MFDDNLKELIEQYLAGEDKAFAELVEQSLKPVFYFTWKLVKDVKDAEDITQEVFFRAWKNIKRFDPKKSFKVWLFSIARNAAIDFLRKKKEMPFSDFDDEEGNNILEETLSDPAPLPDDLLEQENIVEITDWALVKLEAIDSLILTLYYKEELTFEELAVILDMPMNTVKSRQRRALAQLRQLLLENAGKFS